MEVGWLSIEKGVLQLDAWMERRKRSLLRLNLDRLKLQSQPSTPIPLSLRTNTAAL